MFNIRANISIGAGFVKCCRQFKAIEFVLHQNMVCSDLEFDFWILYLIFSHGMEKNDL